MASRGGTFSVLYHVNPPSFEPNKSFSIRSILDLPEDSAEERTVSSSNSSPVESCSISPLQLVPRVVRPMVHHHGDHVPPSGLMNWQNFGVTPYSPHWSYGALPFRDQVFPLGE